MNQLYYHNHTLKCFFESIEDVINTKQLKEMVDLDSIDVVLRECLSIDEMREAGTFFTGQKLSSIAVKRFSRAITFDSVVLDPTCGAGNLLIECSRQLGVAQNLSQTLALWGKVLRGYDLYESFVEATKLRIVLEALNRGAVKDCSLKEALLYFPDIKVVDAMSMQEEDLVGVTHTIMNPPFSSWDSPKVGYWKQGKVNAAGVLFDHYIRNLPRGCIVSAILPDVLRSGSRYEAWREFTSKNIDGICEIYGRFNEKTDIDVFILDGIVSQSEKDISWFSKLDKYIPISDFFDVCIGPLVAYRDPLDGPSFPYVHSKNAPVWSTIKEFDEYRKFKGRVIEPPFVVIRRTSSPSDKYRAAGTIITGKRYIAVENHLIVIKPKSSTFNDCKLLLKVLKSSKTNNYFNNRIRCRHLTVSVVKEIPFR
ncbi:N-6 DNA methylase [Shewanella sp. YLB-07]|uniref:N-6 DNA methylase n=1 Tax=Shewanella sp. YLB-07 TaxID=2601268 RepID=UPI00128E93D3|nr:N-6 DNA methylase [Shewanella sp. YLB-07]MPY23133.1 N-6 DNA methylase [Shewanella sp. YLB-07]